MTNPTTTARVSVLIATYNRGPMLEESLESVLAQTHPPCEIIVIDDGSTDDTASRIARYGGRIRSFRLANGGKARALNAAMPQVGGDFVWVFDDDDVALPTSIADRLAAFTPEAGAVFSKHFWSRSAADGRIEPGELIKWPEVDNSSVALTLMRGCFTTLQGALVRTACYRSIGPFREELLRSQDYDMLIRLVRRFPIELLPRPTFIFRRHEGQRGSAALRHAASERDRVWARYDGLLGRKLRQDTALGEYLVPPVTGALSTMQQRTATLNRLTVMASKGVADAMLEDATQLAACMQRDRPGRLDPQERKVLIGATQESYFLHNTLADPDQFLQQASALNRTRSGRTLLRTFARGLLGIAWWGLHDRPRRRAVWLALRLISCSLAPRTPGDQVTAST